MSIPLDQNLEMGYIILNRNIPERSDDKAKGSKY